MSKLKVDFPEILAPLFSPYRYKVVYGGRGGLKSWGFADALLIQSVSKPLRIMCAREVQNSIRDSVKRLLDDRIAALGLQAHFTSTDTEIRGTNGSLFIFTGLRISPERIKSFEGIDICWIEEAETVSERSLRMLIPTIRKKGSEIWISFNPERINGPVYQKFVVNVPPPDSWVLKTNWRDNPWFPDVLRKEMEHDRVHDPDLYDHVWEGNPVLMARGSYYGQLLLRAQKDGRIRNVPVEPRLLVHTAWDLGMSDSTCIWFFQHLPVGDVGEYRIIDYYEASGEALDHYASVLHAKGYSYGTHIAPHDIRVRELGTGKSRLEVARSLGVRFDIAPDIPVNDGINAVRTILPCCYFDQTRCEQGLQSLWGYQREWDDVRQTFKDKPLHDWASHAADSFRYLALGFRPPRRGGGIIKSTRNYNPLEAV